MIFAFSGRNIPVKNLWESTFWFLILNSDGLCILIKFKWRNCKGHIELNHFYKKRIPTAMTIYNNWTTKSRITTKLPLIVVLLTRVISARWNFSSINFYFSVNSISLLHTYQCMIASIYNRLSEINEFFLQIKIFFHWIMQKNIHIPKHNQW